MIIYKCKMCGGNLNIVEGSKTATCEYCQTQQTVPSTDDEKRANLYNRANHFRQNSEFDKAMGIYEHILEEDSSDAEAYWSIVLCKYGIEYVEDPATKEQKPTVNRTQAQSILKDADYQMALEHADYSQRALYEKEAKEIDRIQSDILQIAQNEQPYDIFISYKEKAPSGERTRSSVLAQDVYGHLKKAGYRVFFSRISLEDKAGQKYEPYIYSALNSSKVMLVIGTQKDEFMAPWVRNEWSRFLTMMREDTGKLLIPCFRDIDIDDLPYEFQILQSQDMSKIGFEQDLLHGISKVIRTDDTTDRRSTQRIDGIQSFEELCKNAETYMKLHDFNAASENYRKITQFYPEKYQGWWGMILSHTEGFNIDKINSDLYSNLDKWLHYVKELTTDKIYHEKLEQYLAFVEKKSFIDAQADIDYTTSLRDGRYQKKIEELNEAIDKINADLRKSRQQYEEHRKNIQNKIHDVEGEENILMGEINQISAKGKRNFLIRIVCGICVACVIASFLGYSFTDFPSVLSSVLFWSLLVIGALSLFSGRESQISMKSGQLEQKRMQENQYKNEIKVAKKSYEEQQAAISRQKDPHNAMIKEYQERIDICNQYLNYGADSIAELLYSLACNKYGVGKAYDETLYGLRKRVMELELRD